MNMDKIAVFIDGAYLDIISRDKFGIKVDYQKVITSLSENYSLFRAYYYYCSPYISSRPTEDEKKRIAGHNKFLYNLKKIPRLELRKGKLEKRNDGFTQKRVDIMMAVDITRLSWRNHIQVASIITGDSDFVPAIKDVKDSGIIVQLYYHKDCVHDELIDCCDDRIELTEEMIKLWEFNRS